MHSNNFIDLTGKIFYRLTVLKLAKPRKNRTFWICKCKCGNEKEIESYALKTGKTKSCGCLRREITAARNTLLITKHKQIHTRFYKIWIQMRNRCNNINNQAYDRYGGKGIFVYKRWDKFENFYTDMRNSYDIHVKEHSRKQTTIDRINNNGNYCKSNCRWATYSVQARNRPYNKELCSKAGKLGAAARWDK